MDLFCEEVIVGGEVMAVALSCGLVTIHRSEMAVEHHTTNVGDSDSARLS